MSSSESNKYDANFVSQEQIDTLLKGSEAYVFFDGEDPLGNISDFINTDEIDRLLGDDDPEEEEEAFTGFHREDEMGDGSLHDEDDFEDEDLSMISMDDIQRVLSEDEATEEASAEALDLNLEAIVETPEDDGELISQDDIDRLLRGSLVDDDEALDSMDEGFQLSPEEMETLLTETLGEAPELEDEAMGEGAMGDEALSSDLPEGSTDEPKGAQGKNRRLIYAVALLVFLLAGGAGWFFLMGGGEEAPSMVPPSTDGGAVEVGPEANALGPGESQVVSRLENFLIPTAQGSDYTFVSMHVVITIRGVESDPIKGYESFYRKRIYDDMKAKFGTLSSGTPVKKELRDLVRKTVGALLAEGVIQGVALENYRLM